MNKEQAAVTATEPTLEGTEEFSFDMSMKKKKKKKKPVDEQASGDQTAVDSALLPVEDALPVDEAISFNEQGSAEPWIHSDRDYTYGELLGRVFSILRQNNPDLAGDRRKFVIIPPIIGREGSKKTAFTNIAELCRRMRRPVEHVTSFLLTEMGTTGSMDANQRLIIKGRFQQGQVENLLRRYIGEYVTCKTCRSPETQLSKENRLFFMTCESCGSTRSVTAIRAGFHAQTGRRVRGP